MTLRLGIQGSGQLVGGLPDPGYFAEIAAARRADGLRLDLGRRSRLVREPDPRGDGGADHVRRGHEPHRDRRRHRPAARCARPRSSRRRSRRSTTSRAAGWCSVSGSAARARRTSRPSGIPVRERRARADEAMVALRRLFASSPASFAGRFAALRGRLDRAAARAAGRAAALGRGPLACSTARGRPAR